MDRSSVTPRNGTVVTGPGEVGGADHPGFPPQLREPHLGDRPVAASREIRSEGLLHPAPQDLPRGGHAAADDEQARVEHRRELRETEADPAADLVEAVQRTHVALL